MNVFDFIYIYIYIYIYQQKTHSTGGFGLIFGGLWSQNGLLRVHFFWGFLCTIFVYNLIYFVCLMHFDYYVLM